jgi:flagellar biosynthesis regulator FlaF
VLAVPRSIASSLEKMPKRASIIRNLLLVRESERLQQGENNRFAGAKQVNEKIGEISF